MIAYTASQNPFLVSMKISSSLDNNDVSLLSIIVLWLYSFDNGNGLQSLIQRLRMALKAYQEGKQDRISPFSQDVLRKTYNWMEENDQNDVMTNELREKIQQSLLQRLELDDDVMAMIKKRIGI